MSETSISRLQKKFDKLNQRYNKLLESNASMTIKNRDLLKKCNKLETEIEQRVIKAVNLAVSKFKDTILKENEELKRENAELKQLLNKSDINGIPTSQTPINKNKRIPNTRCQSTKLKGGQPGHKKHKLEKFNADEITDTHIHEATKCKCGSRELTNLGIYKTKDELDIDIRVQKIRNEFQKLKCSQCETIINTPVPNHLKEDNQYGPNIKALAVSLVNEGFVSFNRTKSLISGFTSGQANMSEGFLVKLQKLCNDNLTCFNNNLKVALINESVVHWDDTVIGINKKRSCLRFYGSNKLALYTAHEQKNKKGIDEDAILKNLSAQTVVVHDHNKVNYNEEYQFANAECCVHLIRDLKKLDVDLPRDWLKGLIKLLVETNEERKKYIEDERYFEMVYIDMVIDKYNQILTKASEINQKDFNPYHGKDERTLINRLLKYKNNYLMWVTRFDVPFDNNLSERGLRGIKTKQKVSGQFANITNARYCASIKSYIETCKKNNLNVHEAIVRLFDGNPYTVQDILKASESTD